MKDWLQGYLAGIVAARRHDLEGASVTVLTHALLEIDVLSSAIEALDEDFVIAGRSEIAKMRDVARAAEK